MQKRDSTMWLLTCDGDLLGHKPIWLRPGSGHLLGRTSGRAEGGEVVRYINHKSVSRKHAIIHVSPVETGASSRLHTRSQIKLTDGSKIGTYINGEKISQTTRTLDKTEYTIKLGNYEHEFHLKWQPVVLTFTNLSKSARARSDPLESQRGKLEQADIKLVTEYITSQTTHVIGKKRNTAAGLQALLQGRWLLAESFVTALATATARPGSDPNGNEQPCPLEEDFEAKWPREEDHIIAAGTEANPRPNEFLKPNAERAELFAHYTFIFLSQQQYESLMPVVTSGGGKALVWGGEIEISQADDLVRFVKEVSGTKTKGHSSLGRQPGKCGVVVVRPSDKEEKTAAFLTSVELALEQRSLEQNQFLDAVLSVDASELRQPLKPESQNQASALSRRTSGHTSPRGQAQDPTVRSSIENMTPEPSQSKQISQSGEGPTEAAEPVTRKKIRRTVTKSRFKGFEEVDPSQFTRPESESPEPSQAPEDDQAMQVDEPPQPEPSQQAGRKRRAPSDTHDAAERERAMMDELLPGAAAMKRRRLQKDGSGGNSSNATPEPDRPALPIKKTGKKKQIDVRAELEAKREREVEEQRKDEESLREALKDVDISDVRAKVESYEIPQREPPPRHSQRESAGPTDRWDPAWNGRKNFKRFRHKGQNNDGPRLPRVIVALEEVPRKGHGIGEEYWLDSNSGSTRGTGKSKSQSQSQPQTQIAQENGDDDPMRFRRRIQNSYREDEENNEMVAGFDHDASFGRSRNSNIQAAFAATPSQTMGTESQRRAAGKRAAPTQDGPAPKRTKSSRPAASREPVVVDDDDEDALKFRRRRR